MIVLKIIGWVLLGILALILLVLCIRIRIAVEYSDDNTNARLEWLFLNLPLYPRPAKEPQKSQTPPPQEGAAAPETGAPAPEEGKPAEKKESLLHVLYRTHGVDGILELVRRVFSYLGSFFGDMMKALVIEELYLDIGCTKKDAAATAIYYGEVCAALYPMLGALASRCKVKKYDINVYPDYLARFSRTSFFVKFHVYPIYVTGITILLVCRMVFKVALRTLIKIFLPKKEKKAEKDIKITEKEDESHEGAVSSRNPVHDDRESASAG